MVHELELRRACEKNGAPRKVVSIVGGVQEHRGKTTSQRLCQERAWLSSSKTIQKHLKNTLAQQQKGKCDDPWPSSVGIT